MKKIINLIIKGLTLVSLALLVFIGFNNNKNKTITYNSESKGVEIYIAPSDEYYFEEIFDDFDYFKMDNAVVDVKVVLYEKNKVLVMYNKSQKVEVYYQNNFYYIIKLEK
jgi:uncharacterized protein YneR